jgi:hypothetical protein
MAGIEGSQSEVQCREIYREINVYLHEVGHRVGHVYYTELHRKEAKDK